MLQTTALLPRPDKNGCSIANWGERCWFTSKSLPENTTSRVRGAKHQRHCAVEDSLACNISLNSIKLSQREWRGSRQR